MASYHAVDNNEYSADSSAAALHGNHGKPKRQISNWIKIGIPVFVLIAIGAILGGVLGSRAAHHSSTTSAAAQSSSASAAASSAASVKNAIGRFATATESDYMMPVYPSTTNTAAFTSPTFNPTNDSKIAWPQDPFQPSSPSPTSVRTDRPRLIAPAYKWSALPNLIANDPYLQGWNETIFGNATTFNSQPPVAYFLDGDSGILDVARDIKRRIKAFAYVYRMTNDSAWVDRTWTELQNAAGNGTTSWGPSDDTKWNPSHFLDTAELIASYAIAYDWMYDGWSNDQKESIRFTMIQFGLQQGLDAYNGNGNGWWANNIEGNWNCVCNSGLTMGALAILGDDTSGLAESLLALTVDNAKDNCAMAVSDDGTWAETANYWYFGTLGMAEMASSLMTATGSDYDLLTVNPNWYKTGQFHMYVQGATSLFNYGDHGPNKYSTTANGMFLFGSVANQPQFQLYQREQYDAAEPNSMFWYDPNVAGAFWDGAALDQMFDNHTDQWMSMRSSWTDVNALYVAMKAGTLQGHQTHNDLDCGDFVIDALGTRWAGELGSGDYLSTGYFSNDSQDSQRWLYYRKRTEGQNTVLVNADNQLVTAQPSVSGDSSGTAQGSSTVENVGTDDTAYFIADLTSANSETTSWSRGIRVLNGRKQVLLQDEITSSSAIMWRMHTNATVNVDSSGTSATLTIGDETMIVQILNAPSGATFTTGPAVRLSTDPALPTGETDQPNPGVTVLMISLGAGTYDLQVLFNPQWSGLSSSDFQNPPSVSLSSWSLTSHNSS